MSKLSKNDFIEIEFTGKVKDGNIFDSNIKSDLEEAGLLNPKNPNQTKPFALCLGQKMFLESIDEFLIGKETGKEFEIGLAPEKAFGKRDSKLIKILPMRVFQEQKLNPMPGMAFNFDGQMAKVISVSGGRVITDFNNPIAGKDVVYKIKVTKKVDNAEEKVKSLMDFFFRREFKFTINDKKILVELSKVEKQIKPLFEALKDKFKEMLGLDLEFKTPEEKKPEKKLDSKNNHEAT